ncbi:Proton-dependent Oligopeptide Transporter (POT) Family [Phytophthora infestans T30-4]|uniref:Proton-dependent Oligopeptide Transporter (POT) Family n=1 Tax=Phytophthora infestans (strain T30-4) TaxID=403677 RepID=D0NHI1_PHYIT|nr:Proton-dependent Oligopeptide Transporter (POT) Family [Phytophthora infestans T30-4]EEY58906.1 Proton-dependent Oligopeptide Transporter (POT) Family [Phytophthora infestans T30-4]|eukprot:XP_002901379.1 Proton-dependent Oligopeptide Transporter (POT) Family [Phytophthora infestans T30-4]
MGVANAPIKSPMGSPAVPYESVQTMWEARPRKYKSVLFQVCSFILMVELAERLSYYGINQGLKNFMQKIGWSLVSASALKSTWTSICYLTPLFGAYLADERWGRFRTILTFGIWYCIGDFLVAIAAYPTIMTDSAVVNPIFIVGLFVGIGIGTGAIKSNVITLGADQFDPYDPSEVQQKESYFSYFYFCINVGSGVSYGYLSVLCVDGSAQIPAEYGYFATYMICACVMVLAVVVLCIGYRRYVFQPPNDRSISMMCRLAALVVNVISAFTVDKGNVGNIFSYIAAVLVLAGIVGWVYAGQSQSFLDVSKSSMGGTFDDERVEGYKKLVRVLPYAAFTIIWNCAYDQTDANFQSITQQCDLRLDTSDPDSKQIPGAMLGVFDPIVIVICIPLLDSVIYPLYTKWAGKSPSQFGKSGVGLIIAIIGIFWAGIFEVIRRNAGALQDANGDPILDGGSSQPMNDISWGAAVPNYVFIGLAECLINVTSYDLVYSSVPMSLKSMAQAVILFMSSMGSILTSVFTIMFSKSLPSDNLNEDHLENMFFTVGAVSVINFVFFVFIMKKMNMGMSSSPELDHLGNEVQDLMDEKLSVSSRHSVAVTK